MMVDRVFISYQSNDARLALDVSGRVKANGLNTYLDKIDDALLNDSLQLADHLLRVMSSCSQIIAVVSASTKNSWWVPWEIGVGSERRMLMASYSESYVSLPSYLAKWPALKRLGHIDIYCRQSKLSSSRMRTLQESTWRTNQQINDQTRDEFFEFHKQLRRTVG